MIASRYLVRPGAELRSNGVEFKGGEVVSLLARVAHEVRHLVDPVNDAGEAIAWPTADMMALEEAVAASKEHERLSLLQAARVSKAQELDTLDQAIAAELSRREAFERALTAPLVDPAAGEPAAVTTTKKR